MVAWDLSARFMVFYQARRRTILASIFAGLALACLCPAQAQVLNDPKLHVRELTSGLSQPTAMAFVGPGDILVLQKGNGRVRRVINEVLQPGEVLDVAVNNASERGLLGIAIHPNFPSTPFVYLYFSQSNTSNDTSDSAAVLANRVYRYLWDGTALVSPSLILDLPATPGPNHDGGTMLFGPDGKLYVVIGDLNRDGQLQNFSAGPVPDDTGVIFRINDDGSAPGDTDHGTRQP
jgi:glucose/arabinose dehydrogenase